MRRFLLLLLFMSLAPRVFSAEVIRQQVALPAARLKQDTGNIVAGKFNQQKIKVYAAQKEFIYHDEAPANESLWSGFWRWFWRIVEDIFGNAYGGKMIRYLLIFAAVALIVFLILKATGVDFRIITSGSRAVDVPYGESQENIHEIDFSEALNNAIAAGNYRTAVRLFYLQTLKKLNDNHMISWQPGKTNQAYIAEIRDPEKQRQFTGLTARFEFIWYGEFFIDREAFDQVKKAFEKFNPKGP